MDPPAADVSRRRAGKGGKARRLGLKQASLAPPQAPALSLAPPPARPPPPISSPTASAMAAASTPTPIASSPSASASTMAPQAPQVPGSGAVPPNFASIHGKPEAINSWIYPPAGGFVNMIEQPHYLSQAQVQEDNFHLVGQTMPFNPISPAVNQANSTNKTVHIDIDNEDNSEANMKAKKRYWTHGEEERLASSWLEASKDPIHGNDKKGDTFWKEVTAEFNRKGNGKRTREFNQLKIHWSRLKSSIGDFNDYWTKVTQMHTSGYSDDMLEEEAQKMYAHRFGKRFQLVHWCKILKEEPKWRALFETDKDKNEVNDILEEQSSQW